MSSSQLPLQRAGKGPRRSTLYSSKALERVAKSKDLRVLRQTRGADARGITVRALLAIGALLWLLTVLTLLIGAPLLRLETVWIVLSVIPSLALLSAITWFSGLEAEKLSGKRLDSLERRLAERDGWKPQWGSTYAPYGEQDFYILRRKAIGTTRPRLQVTLQHWTMSKNGWARVGAREQSKSFTHREEKQLNEFEAQMQGLAERANQEAREQRAELSTREEREREQQQAADERARIFVRVREGSELLL